MPYAIIWNGRMVNVQKSKKDDGVETIETKELEVFTIDVHHFFAKTIEKGKKNDHVMHNTCLDAIISLYKEKFALAGLILKKVIVWTDNPPHQYRCRQTFLKVASVLLRHLGIELIHRLAVADNFKGIHDAVGKVPAHKIRALRHLLSLRTAITS